MTGLDIFIRHPLPVVIVPDDQQADRSQAQASFGRGPGKCRPPCDLPNVGLGLQPRGQVPPGDVTKRRWLPCPLPPWKAPWGHVAQESCLAPRERQRTVKGSNLPAPTLPSWGEKTWVYDMGLPMPPEVWPGDSVGPDASHSRAWARSPDPHERHGLFCTSPPAPMHALHTLLRS